MKVSFCCPPPRVRGFTLIELMVTVSIAAILGAIAYPSFNAYLIRTKAADALDGLAEGKYQMEQYFFSNHTYVSGPCETSRVVGAFTLVCPSSGTGKPSATGYTLSATGSGLAAGLTYTIDQNGTQKTTAVPSGWTAVPTGGHACWILRKGATC